MTEERDVLVVGEALVDIVKGADGGLLEYAGGSAANVAVALARLDRPVRFATAYAEDRLGAMIADHLESAGVRLAVDPGSIERTSTAVATIGADGAASYEFDLAWHLNEVPEQPEPLAVHACSLGAVVQPGADEVHALLARARQHATISYDINARPSITGTGRDVVALVERVVSDSDLVKCSDEDLDALFPGMAHAECARRLLALGPAAVVVTRGAEGALWVDASGEHEVAPRPVTVADTIGAGDTFGAGLIDALWQRGRLGAEHRDQLRELPADEIGEVLEHAAAAAAVTVSRPGADPPYRSELG